MTRIGIETKLLISFKSLKLGVNPSSFRFEQNSILLAPLLKAFTALSRLSTQTSFVIFKQFFLKMISSKSFHSLVISHTKFIISYCTISIPLLNSLPKFSFIITLKHYIIILRLMIKNSSSFF